ncbi:hypothetical protein DCO58_02590 [Helicobacter saguini]|uniref:Outer membrane protein beta-barrel domain-containing protein n=1 Tax=Helicobacter saguini TaxID=1548018 RepID=A0A347VIK2_9HELI|nr:hypothetical protein [Helicobacter saguini]MWV62734.1 hypothetical protein [Helicobacter saguini]MWV66595.1 hypothetical protein [Helicobacter saguini]MWV68946.1 hypothetical protein [Helicobacter saguini]MWV71500.1 hypothetical protein [Helicobacter saguini]TLD92203.1 hypothetical protein LS64_010655 [Helicobacter saguini]
MFKKICVFIAFVALNTALLYAARPMNTDDARVVPYGHCQLETWAEFHINTASEIWALPACNLLWDTEISLGGDIGLENSAFRFQIKKLFVDADKKNWGIGIAVGNALTQNTPYNYQLDELYFYIPASLVLLDSKLVFHANVGYNLANLKTHIFSAGLGMEAQLSSRIFFIGEVYYAQFDPFIFQVGLRTWLLEDMFQIDSTYGNSFDGKNHFFSIGLRLLSPKIRT